MKSIAALIITVCVIANAAASCVATLQEGEHKWATAVVSDIGPTKPGTYERQLKLRIHNWVVTAITPGGVKLSKGDSVEIRQDENALSVKTKNGTTKCPLICIQRVDFVE